jgi:DNA polymerase-3 subunit beta
MKIVCEREALDRALGLVISRARNKTKIPILTHVLLQAADNRLTVAATDLNTASEASLPAEVHEAAATTVAADRFAQLVSLMPAGAQISLHLTEHQLVMKRGRSIYKLPTLSAADWPEMTTYPQEAIELTLPCTDVKRLFGEPAPAIVTDLARPYLEGGCLYQLEPGRIAVVGTDTKRLIRISAAGPQVFDGRYIVPKPSMGEIVKLATEGDVTFLCAPNLLVVKARGCTFVTRLVDGTYPKCEKFIPDIGDYIAVDRAEFVAAMKRLDELTNEYSVLNIRWDEGAQNLDLTLSGEGSGVESVACECGLPAGRVSFYPKILASVLNAFSGEIIQFHITTAQKPVRMVDPAAPEITAMGMPCAPKE